MLNIEIYRKTLRRRDLNVEAPTIEYEEDGDDADDKDKKEDSKEKDESSTSTGTVVNLMSTDSNRIAEFSTWWVNNKLQYHHIK